MVQEPETDTVAMTGTCEVRSKITQRTLTYVHLLLNLHLLIKPCNHALGDLVKLESVKALKPMHAQAAA